MRRIFLYLLLFSAANLTAQDKKNAQLLQKAEQAFKYKKFAEALPLYEQYLARDTSLPEIYSKIAQIHFLNKNYPQAITNYKTLIRKDTIVAHYPQAYAFLGTRCLELNDFEKAKKYFENAIQVTNRNSVVYQQLKKQLATASFGLESLRHPLEIHPKPFPEVINARDKQYFPVLTVDNQTLIFTARNDGEDENIYQSDWKDNKWTEPRSISKKINSAFNEGTCSVSPDGKTMVFTSCEGRETLGSCDLYITKLVNGQWDEPKNLGNLVNSKYWDSQPTLSSDGTRLFFSSERPGGVGKKDIWMSQQNETGEWQSAVNLGRNVNTPFDEDSPFLHANGNSLFFSSNGKPGMGNFDVFMVNAQNYTTNEVINLGFPINTSADELSMFISSDGKRALYSVETQHHVKLYQFEIPEKLAEKIDRTYYLKGYIIDEKSNKPLYATLDLISTVTNQKISRFVSDPITGDYMAILPADGEYMLYIESPGYLFNSHKFAFSKNNDGSQLDIKLKKIEKETKTVLQNIFFDSGSTQLRENSFLELNKLISLLQQNARLKIEISGHTDDVGNDNFNLSLSQKRAENVVKFLVDKGIDPSRIKAVGYGEIQPIVNNDNDTNRQLNRRIEMKFL